VVDVLDAGAQSIFVMINSISEGWDDGVIDVVTGLDFADGVSNSSSKTWNFVSNTLFSDTKQTLGDSSDRTGTDGRGYYKTMVKFRIDEYGVLKTATRLNTVEDDDKNIPAKSGEFISWNPGNAGAFSITITNSALGTAETLAFEANTVLYKIDGGVWTAVRPSEGNFKTDDAGTVYEFLKTDPDEKAYDVIIKK
jgi:hypothetical protein